MVATRLLTRDGSFVATVQIPPFQPPAEIVSWGSRFFVFRDGEYREGLLWVCVGTGGDAGGIDAQS